MFFVCRSEICRWLMLTLMPWKRESARSGRKARRVLIVLNAWILPAPSHVATRLITDTYGLKVNRVWCRITRVAGAFLSERCSVRQIKIDCASSWLAGPLRRSRCCPTIRPTGRLVESFRRIVCRFSLDCLSRQSSKRRSLRRLHWDDMR